MGFRIRKSVRLGKGLRINLSKSGPSLSIRGGPFTTNISSHGVRRTTHIAKGLSYTTTTSTRRRTSSRKRTGARPANSRRPRSQSADIAETKIRVYATAGELDEEAAKLASDGWSVVNVTEHRATQGCFRLLMGGFLFRPKPQLIVTYARTTATAEHP